ncbi:unnamed protein product [Orchesella dallaii]|uniref:Kazal-like domain-containing protein n=1 Tax=Orchesella dallaii TaxID=48710 RepID=A0ABP1RBG5_9HEXA
MNKLLFTFTLAIAIFLMVIVSESNAEDEAAAAGKGDGNSTATTAANKKALIELLKKRGGGKHHVGVGNWHGKKHHFVPPGYVRKDKKHCPCPFILKYVCGSDNVTYSNECDLKCQGVEKAHDGSCEDPNQHTPHPLHPAFSKWGGGRGRHRGRGKFGKLRGSIGKNGTEEVLRTDVELAANDEPEDDGKSGEAGSKESDLEVPDDDEPLPDPTPKV